MRVRALLAILLTVVAVGCTAPPPSHAETVAAAVTAPVVTEAPSTAPSSTPSPSPAAASKTLASPAPTAAASPLPSESPAPKHHVFSAPMRSPDAPPQIYSVQVNTTDVGSGDTLWGKVLTSSNVASVEVRVATYGVGLQKVGVGRFTLAYRLGSIPFFVRGTYPMRIIARNTRGDTAERTLPLKIH